jgi:superoxide dismutase
MKADLSAKSIAVQGSGWGWLGYNPTTGLSIFVLGLFDDEDL